MQFTRVGGKPANGRSYREVARNLQKYYEDEIARVGEGAEDELRSVTRRAGTGNVWSAGPSKFMTRSSWQAGDTGDRIDTGDMLDDLNVRVYRGKGIGLDVGWIYRYRDYYGLQDVGFSTGGLRGSQEVAGMGVIAHMSVWLRKEVDAALTRAEKRIQNEL